MILCSCIDFSAIDTFLLVEGPRDYLYRDNAGNGNFQTNQNWNYGKLNSWAIPFLTAVMCYYNK